MNQNPSKLFEAGAITYYVFVQLLALLGAVMTDC